MTRGPLGEEAPPRNRPGEPFLKGPIPIDWLRAAGRLRGRALHVGVVLWHHAGMARCATIAPSLRSMGAFGVTLATASRALADLERIGLIRVERHHGRKGIVTLLEAPRS